MSSSLSAFVLAVAATVRERSVWVVPFILTVMSGEGS